MGSDQTVLRKLRDKKVCLRLCVCDECLIVSGEISDISGAETDNISLIRGKGR